MDQVAGDLALGEVSIPVVHRLELVSVDRDALALQNADPAAEFDEPRAGLSEVRAIVAPEVGNRLVVEHQLAGQPHYLDVAASFPLQAPTGRDPVQVAVDEKLEQNAWVISGSTRACRSEADKAEA
jgi:hypothetical protein